MGKQYYEQSAVIPYRRRADRLEVLLITSMSGRRWVIPKGLVEPHLSPPQSAAMEAWEEAGLEGPVSEQMVGSYEYRKWKGVCRVQVFTMQVAVIHEDWPEADERERRWFSPTEAARRVVEPELREMLLALEEMVG